MYLIFVLLSYDVVKAVHVAAVRYPSFAGVEVGPADAPAAVFPEAECSPAPAVEPAAAALAAVFLPAAALAVLQLELEVSGAVVLVAALAAVAVVVVAPVAELVAELPLVAVRLPPVVNVVPSFP